MGRNDKDHVQFAEGSPGESTLTLENKIVRLLFFLGGTTLETLEYRKFRSAR